ncbi:TonB-linked outer membrane protein, SusC/RagA family [Pedobacter nyackensis]|uniref:TonB-linked outer membrane protein, SusC/RagA family n=2 Tax=Pedobacter nyackensis TaxID=475255 RepID=A0A1W2EPW2_9SPHI|nr:TonB-linked outer membrane protein, SusC/RagA family [Pedobacter nyackensis]
MLKRLLTMKLTVILLIIGLLLVSVAGFSQRITYVKKKTSLSQLFDEIYKQTGYGIIWSEKKLKNMAAFDADFHDAPLETVLKISLKNQPLTYIIKDKTIVLRERDSVSVGPGSSATLFDVMGSVLDENGKPLAEATIKVKGILKETISDVNGNFFIEGLDKDKELIISFVGYHTKQVSAAAGNLIVNMSLKLTDLEVVLISVGYGTLKKTSVTGAVSTVNAKDFQSTPTSSLSNLLAGRLPGAQIVNNSGFVGANSNILVRGVGSGTGGTYPLVVIDNVVASRTDFDVLDANEVESITLLKDAGTAAIYGSRAANGVLLVKTRSGGINQKAEFTLKAYTSTDRTTKPIPGYTATDELVYKNNQYIHQQEIAGQPIGALPYGQAAFDYYKDKSYHLMDYVWRNPSAQQYDLTVSGGSEEIQYFMLAGFNKANGSFENTDYNRYNFRSKVDASISKKLKIGLNLSGYRRGLDRFYWPYDAEESQTVQDFYRTTFNWSRLYPFYTKLDGTATDRLDPQGLPAYGSGGWNPVETIYDAGYRKTVYNTLNGILNIDLKIPFIPGLSTSVMGNYNVNTRNNKSFIKFNKSYPIKFKSDGVSTRNYLPVGLDLENPNIHNLSNALEAVVENVTLRNSYQLNWFLNYSRTFHKHDISANLIYEQSESNAKVLTGSAGRLISSDIDQIMAASKDASDRSFNGSESANARLGWIGRIHYEYDSKYIAEFSFREDGSYIFEPGHRFGFFPSASAAWRISKEKFFNVDFISELKLRGSYGTTGHDGTTDGSIAAYQWQNNYYPGSSYVFGNIDQFGIAPGRFPNSDITWEKTSSYDLGLDFGLFNGALSGEFDYFKRRISDIFQTRAQTLPGTFGAVLPQVNYAKKDVSGFDFSLQYHSRTGEISYLIGANVGYATDKWVIYDEPAAIQGTWRSQIGQPTNRLNGYISEGIIRDQSVVDVLKIKGFKQFGRDPMIGALLFKDIRGVNYSEGPDGKIDENDKTYLSNNQIPRINYGINLSVEWKAIKVDILLQGVSAYDKMVSTANTNDGGVFQFDRPYFGLWTDAWSTENPNGKYPKIIGWGYEELGFAPSSFWIGSGAYLRLKNVNISYSLPGKWINKIGIKQAQAFFTGTNLLTISAFKAYDPEQLALDSYPIMKGFTGGLNIVF